MDPLTLRPHDLYSSPNALAGAYSRFRVADRLLLTGHSHQAWPDRGFAAQQQAWLDAAEFVDDKWPLVFAKAEEVRNGYRRLLNDPGGDIALDQNTLDLVVRFISALPLRQRPRLVSTSGEFHTIRRLLDRLAEEGIEIDRSSASPRRNAGLAVGGGGRFPHGGGPLFVGALSNGPDHQDVHPQSRQILNAIQNSTTGYEQA